MNEKRIVESFRRRRRQARADVNAHRHAELFGLRVKRIEIGMVEVASGGVARHGNGDKTELFNAPFELLCGFLRFLLGDQRDTLQPSNALEYSASHVL